MWCAHTALPGRNLNDDQRRSSPGVHLARGRAGVEDEGYSLQGAPRLAPPLREDRLLMSSLRTQIAVPASLPCPSPAVPHPSLGAGWSPQGPGGC